MGVQQLKEKTFDLTLRRPNVLLLGNGLVYDEAYNWNKIIERVKRKDADISSFKGKKVLDGEKTEFKVPYSILVAATAPIEDKTRYESYVRELTLEPSDNNVPTKRRNRRKFESNDLLNKIIRMPFDAILTTNYTYEIENAQLNGYPELSNKRKCDLSAYYSGKSIKKKSDTRYLIHTCNKLSPTDTEIWHIHGELRRPTSMILSHNEYAHLCHSILSHNDIRSGHYGAFEKEFHITSWVDYFMVGNVFILGLSMDYTEFDLWWLLTRRQREELGSIGKVVFYEMAKEENVYKHQALRSIGVDVRAIECDNDNYDFFYRAAISDIEKMINV